MVITEIDDYFFRAKVPIPYPCVVIKGQDVTVLPIVLDALEDGNVSIVFEYDNKFNVPQKKISCSALTLERLLQVFKFDLLKSETERFSIRAPVDILEVGEWSC